MRSAIEIIRQEGLPGLSARNVAKKMGSSTAPVYSYFSSMDELEREALETVRDLAIGYTRRDYADRRFLSIGMGFAIFARDENALFRAFYLENEHHRDLLKQVFEALRDDMRKDTRFANMGTKDRAALLQKMWTFTFGLATQIAYGIFDEPEDSEIKRVLEETGSIVIRDALEKSRNRGDQK